MAATSWMAVLFGWLPLFVGIPLGVPPGPQDPVLAQIAPDECMFYSSWAPLAKPDGASKNETEKLLAEPEIQRAAQRMETELKRALSQMALREQDRTASIIAQLTPLIARSAMTQGGAIYLANVEVTPSAPPNIQGAAVLGLGEDSKEIMGLLDSLASTLPQKPESVTVGGQKFMRLKFNPQAPELTWGQWKKYLVIGVGQGAVEQLVKKAGSAAPKWHGETLAALKVPRVSTLSYINVAKIRTAFAGVAGPQASAVIDALGLGNVQSMISVSGLDESGFLSLSRLNLEGAPQGMVSVLAGKPLTKDDLQGIPANALVAITLRLDLGKAISQVEESIGQIDPSAAAQFRAGLDQVNAALQIDIENDLLGSLGDVWSVYTAPQSGGLFGGWTASVSVRDANRLRRTHDMLVGLFRGQVRRDGPKIKTMKAGDTDIFFMTMPDAFPFAPAWTITEDELVIGLYPQTVVTHITQRGKSPSLAEAEAVAEALGKQGGPLSLSYLDTQALFDVAYPFVQAGVQMVLSEARIEGDRVDISLLPPASAIRPHLQPTLSALYLTPEGFYSVRRQSFPGASLGASAPVATALLLPAVQQARASAMRMQSSNNLKQMGLALHNFHDVYGGFPAAYSTDKDGKPLLSWRVYILPFIEQQPLFNQFHLDEPWDSEHNKKLIEQMPVVYASPTSSAGPGMTVYVTPRSEVSVFPPPDGKKQGQMPTGVRLQDVTDGTSNTIAILEVSDESAVIWTKPDDFEYNPENPLAGAMGQQREGVLATFCDGSVRVLANILDPAIVNALLTRNGREPIQGF